MGVYQNVRPTDFDGISGNTSTITSLRKVLQMSPKDRPHAILFKGPSGCGKTTLARILTKQLNCQDIDILELNAANTRGIEAIREILKQVNLRPFGEARAFILDESHQLTPAAQEALLKSLEDCPDFTYFIICTTEPEHLIKTIRNRCTEYEVNLLGSHDMTEVLARACKKASLTVEADLIEGIVHVSEGSARNALVFLEQVQGMSVDEGLPLLISGTSEDPTIIELCSKLSMLPKLRKASWLPIIQMYSFLSDDPEKIRRSILGYMWRKLTECDEIVEAEELTYLLRLFSTSVYYGGKAQLGAIVARACFDTPKF